MRRSLFSIALAATLLLACGGEDEPTTDTSTTGGGNGGSTTTTTGGGGTASGGGSTGAGCEGITPMRNILTPEQLLTMLDNKDFELINVHVPYAGEIPGTDAHIAYTDVDAIEAHLGNDKAAKVVLYCRTGPMSQIAGDDLVSRGYCNLSDMSAGSYTWETLGHPYTP
jgi:rhodanese-related sulfurtransferase